MEKSGTMNLLLIAAIGGMAIYLLSKATQIGSAATNAVSSAAADLWVTLTSSGPVQVLGNVVLPDGSVVAISSLQWREDTQGNAYTQVNGSVYELSPRDGNGNFTLTQVA
jgi:hypothetical protein